MDHEIAHERAGVYLAAVAALAVPSLIVLALFLPALSPSGSSDENDGDNSVRRSLDHVAIEMESTGEQGVPADVAGAGEIQSDLDSPISDEVEADADSSSPSSIAAAAAPTTTAPATTTRPTTTREPANATSTTTNPPTTTDTSTTTDTPTTTTVTPEEATTSTTSTTTAAERESTAFAQRIDFGRIGETTVHFRFTSSTTTSYTAIIRQGLDVISQSRGTAQADVLVNETISNLSAGTEYTVEVELDGPPIDRSPRVSFRTSGGQPESAVDDVAVVGLRVAQLGATRFEVNYESNICANGSFVIREQGGGIVGRNAGQAAGCTTRHTGIPGFWTAALQPNTTYVITVQVEANGARQGNGNTATQSLTVTTSTQGV